MEVRDSNTFSQETINWKGWVEALLWHQYIFHEDEYSGYELVVKPAEYCSHIKAGDIVGDIRILSYSIGETKRLTWRELALVLGLLKEYLLTDGHDCQKCPDYKKCKAYFKDDKKQLRCNGWTDDKTLDERYQEFMDEIMKPLTRESILKTLTEDEIKELDKYGILVELPEEVIKKLKKETE